MTTPDPDARPPWWGAASILYPELPSFQGLPDDSPGAALLGQGLLGLAADIVTLLGTVMRLNSASVEPVLRTVVQELNERHPTVLPGPSDLVRFQVREVFDPQLRARLLGTTDLSQFKALMLKHGFAPEHAESYWAAHWELPSATQAFEMLHRLRPGRVGDDLVFTVDDLRSLLARLDVAPEYIERLVRISYAPLTRVDVRRMYQQGVLSLDDVREAYLDLGYDEKNAQFLADFTRADTSEEEKALSLDRYARAYREGLVTRDDFIGALRALGFAPAAVDLSVALEDKAINALERRAAAERTATLRRYQFRIARESRRGTLDEELIRFELEQLGVSPVDSQRMLDINRARGLSAVKDLTRADILAAFKVGVVTERDARAELGRQGLDEREVSTLIDTAKRSIRKADAKEKDLTRADILRLTKKGLMTPPEAVERLKALGFSADAAARLVDEIAPTEN